MKWKNYKQNSSDSRSKVKIKLKDGVYLLYNSKRDSFLFSLMHSGKWFVRQAGQLLPVPPSVSDEFTHYARIVKPNEKAQIHQS